MTKKISIASIMTSLSLVCLFGSAYIPTGKIALMALTSMCMLATVSSCGVHFSWLQFIATSLLALLLIPAKGQVFLYIAILGYYPILKLHIESLDNLRLEWLIKMIYFNALLIVIYFLLRFVLLTYISLGAIFDFILANTLLVVFISEAVFVLYDYFLSFFAKYYNQIIKNKIEKK